MTAFGIQAFKLNNVFYAGARGQQFDRGREFESDGADGTTHETFHAIRRAKQMADLTSTAVKTLLGVLSGSTDLPLIALDAANGLVLYGAKAAASAPGYAGGSVHHSRACLNGVVYCSGVRWSPGNAAEIMLKALLISTAGGTDPVVISTIALPTQQIPTEFFTLSAFTLAGGSPDTVNSLELQIDPKFDFDYSLGLPFPVMVTGAGAKGRLQIRLLTDIADPTLAEGTGATAFTLTSHAQGGTIGAATATFTLNNPWTTEENWGGSNSSPLGRRLITRPRWDNITKPLTWGVT